ncbi:uncharacterized protein BDR25DRAFT_155842, partial [Lindgomyces ingoldianus]
DYWDSKQAKECANPSFTLHFTPMRKAIRESVGHLYPDTCAALGLLVVDPKFQRRGARRILVQCGAKVADRISVEAVVEAGLYNQEGFEVLKDHEIPLLEWGANKTRQRFSWIKRPAK